MTHIDVEALREKYQKERQKRLRATGTAQYNFAEGKFADYNEDPHSGPPVKRQALVEEIDVLIIGGGFGGIQAAAALRKAGVDNFRILDVAADFGGTWYWNRYPGVRCDVEAYIYLPLLEDTQYVPTERYTGGAEILAYSHQLGRHFDLYSRALFQTRVTGMTWDEPTSRWIVSTSQGDQFATRFVTTQSGIFSRPQLPGIPGIATFTGKTFHTSRWDYDYTGGDSSGGLNKLHDKRVGLIGTGSTSLQAVPHLAAGAQQLMVFQRTPSAVGPRDNAPTDREWFDSLPVGWQKERMENFNAVTQGGDFEESLVDDGWARFGVHLKQAVLSIPEADRTPEAIASAVEEADLEWNEMIRGRVDTVVIDHEKAEMLKAYYKTGCKRPGFSDDYLPAFNRDNVTLVDTSATRIDRITENGVVVAGVEYELDTLIFATGFELGTSWSHQAGYDITGRNGQSLSDKWQKGIRSFHGLFSNGFPNIFFMGLTQTGATTNVPHMLQEQVEHIAFVVQRCLASDIASIEATPEAEAEWVEVIRAKNVLRRPSQLECTPGYFNNEGKPEDETSAIASGIFYPSKDFFDILEGWRRANDFRGLKVLVTHHRLSQAKPPDQILVRGLLVAPGDSRRTDP